SEVCREPRGEGLQGEEDLLHGGRGKRPEQPVLGEKRRGGSNNHERLLSDRQDGADRAGAGPAPSKARGSSPPAPRPPAEAFCRSGGNVLSGGLSCVLVPPPRLPVVAGSVGRAPGRGARKGVCLGRRAAPRGGGARAHETA